MRARFEMTAGVKRGLALVDVVGLPLFILAFIWRLQFTTNWAWLGFVVWMIASFALQCDTPATLGWRGDNLWPATRRAAAAFVILAFALFIAGVVLHAPWRGAPDRKSTRLKSRHM